MSVNTRSRRRDALAAALLVATLLVLRPAAAVALNAPPLPPAVVSLAPLAQPVGGGELRFLGLAIYEGFYWAPARAFALGEPFALDLHYRRSLDGAKIAERSLEEIAQLGYGTTEERAEWMTQMRRIFPDVRKGDRITGVNLPGRGARFFHNGSSIGEIADSKFARAFFAIWLDPKTSRPDFRRQLLGER